MPDPIFTTAEPLDQVTAAVRRFCGWHIAPQITETVTVDGSGSLFQPLPTLRIAAVTSVVENGISLDLSSFEWSASGLLWRSYPWSGHFRAVTVTMTHGFALADVPDLAGVLAAKAARVEANPRAAVRVQAGPFSEQYETASGFTLDEERVLAAYRIPGRP